MHCYSTVARTVDTTFTLRDNVANTVATCAILSGAHTGSTTGLSVAFTAGDLLDVASPAANGAGKASFAVAVGP